MVYVVGMKDDLDRTLMLFNPQAKTLRRVIIIGAGQAGTALATSLDHTKVKTRLIDKDSALCTRVAEGLARVVVITGDGTDKGLLQEENVVPGDYVLVHVGYAIQKLEPEEAAATWEILEEVLGDAEDA